MMATLNPSKEKYRRWLNIRIEYNAENPLELNVDIPASIHELFMPYAKVYDEVNCPSSQYHIPDTLPKDKLNGFYVTDLNAERDLDEISHYKLVSYVSVFYGVSDNASQIYEYLEREGFVGKQNKYIVLMTPMYKDTNPGFRWHKWGRYIGNNKHRHECLGDEDGIDAIFVFSVYELK